MSQHPIWKTSNSINANRAAKGKRYFEFMNKNAPDDVAAVDRLYRNTLGNAPSGTGNKLRTVEKSLGVFLSDKAALEVAQQMVAGAGGGNKIKVVGFKELAGETYKVLALKPGDRESENKVHNDLVATCNEGVGSGYVLDKLEEAVEGKGKVLMYGAPTVGPDGETGFVLLGLVTYKIIPGATDIWYISTLCGRKFDKHFRGVGGRLLAEIFSRMNKKGCLLLSSVDDPDTRKFYLSYGFADVELPVGEQHDAKVKNLTYSANRPYRLEYPTSMGLYPMAFCFDRNPNRVQKALHDAVNKNLIEPQFAFHHEVHVPGRTPNRSFTAARLPVSQDDVRLLMKRMGNKPFAPPAKLRRVNANKPALAVSRKNLRKAAPKVMLK